MFTGVFSLIFTFAEYIIIKARGCLLYYSCVFPVPYLILYYNM